LSEILFPGLKFDLKLVVWECSITKRLFCPQTTLNFQHLQTYWQ